MGRPRTPTALKLVKGTAQACRINPGEPEPDRGIPDPPEHLSERALAAWPGIAGLLDGMGVLTRADGLVLEALCETYAELQAAREALRARGGETTYESINVKTGSSMWKTYPEVGQIKDLDRRFAMWLAKVGLTPADRSRVSAVGGERNADPWDNI